MSEPIYTWIADYEKRLTVLLNHYEDLEKRVQKLEKGREVKSQPTVNNVGGCHE